MKKQPEKKLPSPQYDYLVKNGMDELVALEIDEYENKKGKRRKRLEDKDRKEEKWN